MRVRQIGTLVFDENTNIVVDANAQDAPGIGFHTNKLFDPIPFSVEIAFKRATRQQALNAINALARELYSYTKRRQNDHLAVAGGTQVIVEDAAGGATLLSYLRDSSVTLLNVEPTAAGVVVRVRLAGTLVSPFSSYLFTTTTIYSLKPYEKRDIVLSSTDDTYLYQNSVLYVPFSMSNLRNVLLAIEERESASSASRITAINASSVSAGITTSSWDAGWQTLSRAEFTSATSGSITYTVPTAIRDVYRLFIEIYCPTAPPTNARFSVSWGGQPQITEPIAEDRSWYTPALLALGGGNAVTVSLNIQNVPAGTLVMPLVLVPVDGVNVWNVVTGSDLYGFNAFSPSTSIYLPFAADPTGVVYGPPGFVSGRRLTVFNGAMVQNITNASAIIEIYSYRVEPAAYA